MRTPKSRLIDAVLPLVAQGSTALALAALLAGCDCTSRFLVSIDEAKSDELRSQYHGEDLAAPACDKLCVPPGALSPDGGAPPQTATEAGFAVTFCHVVKEGTDSAVYCSGHYPDACIGGRRPALLADRPISRDLEQPCRDEEGTRDVGLGGASFAALARMESAAVLAFVELAVELHAHGAPEPLVRRALGAAIEEVRHAEVVAGLAIVRGVTPEVAVVGIAEVRTFDRMLLDNAVEGRAREAWGAIAAAADARRERDPRARRALARIAVEEAGHAELSRAIEEWGFGRATATAKRRAREARIEEVESLVGLVEAEATVGVGALEGEVSVARVRAFARAS